ncbi:hypothetical protein K7711_02810 [Nocardia sp. CA2R105]|uniref:hypothetical protein n=1 Tax=Nocardia coffeae TaxID=2873381 RepID=UPI001CA66FA4|nr:hypothetical protein [Nocardia coffeae]MBY8855398.1 hypothetical protein [Nocardia coffeae]
MFDSYAHQQIWDLVHEKLDPAAMGQIASGWSKVQDKIHEVFDTFSKEVKREFAEWSGEFAAAAQKSADAFVSAGGDAYQTAYTVQRLMDLNADAASTVKAAIPPPPAAYKPNPDPAKEAANGAARTSYNTQAAALTADARDAMNNIYNPTMPASGDGVPRFVPAPPALSSQPALTPATAAPVATKAPAQAAPATTAPTKDGKPTDGKPGDQTQNDNPQQPGTASDHTQPNSTQTAASSATTPASTQAAQQTTAATPGVSTTSQTNASPVASGTSPSTPGITAIGLGGESGSAGSQTPGRSLQPEPGTSRSGEPASGTKAETARTAQTPTTTSRSPTSGMPHAPHAGHGKKESEDERSKMSPDYLRRQYEELSDLPPGMLDVIGVNSRDPYEDLVYTAIEQPPIEEPTIYVGTGPMSQFELREPVLQGSGEETAPEGIPPAATTPNEASTIHVGRGPMDEPEPIQEGPEGTSS